MKNHIDRLKSPKNLFLVFFRPVVILFFTLLFLSIFNFGCKKFVDVGAPATSITSTSAYSTNQSAAAVVTSIYDEMSADSRLSSGRNGISLLQGLAADELKSYSTQAIFAQFYTNALNGNDVPYGYWQEVYKEIHVANAVLENLPNSTGVSAAEKQQLIGEAEFMRAFFHFYGVNLFGDIPLVTSTNYMVNNSIHRSPVAAVYQQIISDLLDAQSRLNDNFVDGLGNVSTLRVRPNKAAATALLARVYLYMGSGHYVDAEKQASDVINNTNYSLVHNLDSVFLANSNEAIWQLQPIRPGYNTYDAQYFVLKSAPNNSSYPVALSTNLLNTFEIGDNRFTNWVGKYTSGSQTYYYPYKYKIGTPNVNNPVTEYLMVLRLAEQYLIRAEARAQQGKLTGNNSAISDLNIIRNRAGLPNYTGATDQASILTAILHERQVEMFTEWGHRWFDLKRSGTINNVMSIVTPLKGGVWKSDWTLIPIPLSEITINPNLTQNPGY